MRLRIRLTLILLTLLSFTYRAQSQDTIQIEPLPHTAEIIEEFSKENMFKYMDELGIKYTQFAMAQAIHESANFRSGLFKNNNNLFGMKKAQFRETTALGTRNKYAYYRNWKDSVKDYYLMQQVILKKHKTKKAYFTYIFKNYAKDPQYRKKLQKYTKG